MNDVWNPIRSLGELLRSDPWSGLWLSLFLGMLVLSLRMVYVRSKSYNPLSDRGWQGRLKRSLGIGDSAWRGLDMDSRRMLRELSVKCRKRGVGLMVTAQRGMTFMRGGGFLTVSHFDSDRMLDRPEFYLAIGGPSHIWNKALLREMSRMEQWSENCVQWRDRMHQGGDCREILEQWVTGRREMASVELDEVVRKCVALDLDCHRRTVRKMVSLGGSISFDVHDYVRMANAEIWGYYVIKLRRSWWGVQPSGDFDLWSAMPGVFMREMDYLSMPLSMVNRYEAVCYGVNRVDYGRATA